MIRNSLSLQPSIFNNTATATTTANANADAYNNGLGLITVTAVFRSEPAIAHTSK